MNWCTISDMEQEKCNWFKQASLNQGLHPIIECHQTQNKLDCLKSIQNKEADIVTIEDYGYIALK